MLLLSLSPQITVTFSTPTPDCNSYRPSSGQLAYNLPLMNFDELIMWKRAFIANALGAVGVGLGFASSGVRLSPTYAVPIAIFVLAFLNLVGRIHLRFAAHDLVHVAHPAGIGGGPDHGLEPVQGL